MADIIIDINRVIDLQTLHNRVAQQNPNFAVSPIGVSIIPARFLFVPSVYLWRRDPQTGHYNAPTLTPAQLQGAQAIIQTTIALEIEKQSIASDNIDSTQISSYDPLIAADTAILCQIWYIKTEELYYEQQIDLENGGIEVIFKTDLAGQYAIKLIKLEDSTIEGVTIIDAS